MRHWLLSGLLWAAAASLHPVQAEEPGQEYDVTRLLRLAEGGDLRAAFQLGSRFAARGGEEDAAAVQWFTRAAEGGLAEAQHNLGVMISNGRGSPRDDAQAARWFRRAAEQGFAVAQFNLAGFYASGRGVPRDEAVAAEWLERAAAQGLAPAQHHLGLMHEFGRGVPRDLARALAWYEKAAGQGYTPALRRRQALAQLPGNGSPAGPAARAPADVPHAAPPGAAAAPDPVDWVRAQPAGAYTLQLLSVQDLAAARRFLDRELSGREAGLYAASKNGKRLFSVVLGRFEDPAAARQAARALAPALRRLGPWVRRFADIHAEMSGP